MPRKPLGELIVERRYASAAEVRRLMGQAEENGALLGVLAVNEGLLTERQLKGLLAEQAGVEPLPDNFRFKPELNELLPANLAKKYGVVPLKSDRRKLAVGTSEPENLPMLDELAFATGKEIVPYLMLEGELADALDEIYRELPEPPPAPPARETAPTRRRLPESEPTAYRATAGENVALNLLSEALEQGAQSIHLRLTEGELEIQFRLSGRLEPGPHQSPGGARALFNQLKVLAGMPSVERAGPQQGHFRVNLGGKTLTVASFFTPILNGERALLLLETRKTSIPGYEELGVDEELQRKLDSASKSRHGLLVFSGPPFSGKKDLIYSMLDRLDLQQRAVLTVEEQAAYDLAGVDILRPLVEEGLDYRAAVNAALQQDPDLLFVDDLPTAEIARRLISAAYSRTLVILRLPSSGIITALLALGQMSDEPFLFASSLLLAVSQRQLRRLCRQCRRPYTPGKAVIQGLGLTVIKPMTFYEAPGCPACNHDGIDGTITLYEHLEPNSQIRQLLSGELSIEELSRAARRTGIRSAREAALDLAIRGEVSVSEVLRIT